MEITSKRCKYCNSLIERVTRNWHDYCSPVCRKKYHTQITTFNRNAAKQAGFIPKITRKEAVERMKLEELAKLDNNNTFGRKVYDGHFKELRNEAAEEAKKLRGLCDTTSEVVIDSNTKS